VAVDLMAAQKLGLVRATITGDGIQHVDVELESLNDQPLEVTVPLGTVFLPLSAGTQSMVVTEATTAGLDSRGAREALDVPAACSGMYLDTPGEGDGFVVGADVAAADLLKLLALPAFLEQGARVQQFAVWTITDRPSRYGYVELRYTGSLRGASSEWTGPTDDEIGQIRALFLQAGIDMGNCPALQ
jgi:hypothetical protein